MASEENKTVSNRRSAFTLYVALAVATVLKLLWASHSIGSVDAILFKTFASEIEETGLKRVYTEIRFYNHTPLTSAVISGIYQISKVPIELPASAGPAVKAAAEHRREVLEMQDFTFWLRLLSILMDAIVVLSLYRCRRLLGDPPLWALCLLALSPVSLMISGFHGNIDGVMIGFLVLATLASIGNRPILSAVLFALACNVKIVPLCLAPVFFFFWLPRGKAWRFTVVTMGLLFLGFLWGLINCPAEFVRNVFGYASYWGNWGLTLALRLTGWAPVQELDFLKQTGTEIAIMQALKFVIVAGIAAIGWLRRNQPAPALMATLAMAWLCFSTLAPGVGTQYFVWLAPFLAIAYPRAYALHLTAASIFLFAFYSTVTEDPFPWKTAIPRIYEHHAWALTGGLCWLASAVIFIAVLRRRFHAATLSEMKR